MITRTLLHLEFDASDYKAFVKALQDAVEDFPDEVYEVRIQYNEQTCGVCDPEGITVAVNDLERFTFVTAKKVRKR